MCVRVCVGGVRGWVWERQRGGRIIHTQLISLFHSNLQYISPLDRKNTSWCFESERIHIRAIRFVRVWVKQSIQTRRVFWLNKLVKKLKSYNEVAVCVASVFIIFTLSVVAASHFSNKLDRSESAWLFSGCFLLLFFAVNSDPTRQLPKRNASGIIYESEYKMIPFQFTLFIKSFVCCLFVCFNCYRNPLRPQTKEKPRPHSVATLFFDWFASVFQHSINQFWDTMNSDPSFKKLIC